jgi:diguanylate cyclase (GGDEF)-like protein
MKTSQLAEVGHAGLWALRHVLPFACVGAAAGLITVGAVSIDARGLTVSVLCAAALMAFIVREALQARCENPDGWTRSLVELRLLVPAAALLQLGTVLARSAGLELGAVLYLFALVSVTFFSRAASVPALATVIAVEWLCAAGPAAGGPGELSRRLAFSLFLTFFGAFGLAFLRTEILRIRAKGKERLDEKLRVITEQAREFRLMSAPSSHVEDADEGTDSEDDRRAEILSVTSALHEIHSTIYTLLDVVRRTMGLNTCVLLWEKDSGEYLGIFEAATSAGSISESPIPAHFGLTGAVVAHGKPVRICPVPRDAAPIPYYVEKEDVGSFCAMPVEEGSVVRGVLCADRLTEDAFTDAECEVLDQVAEQAVRIISTERLFLQLVKSKTEQSRLYRASTRLREAHTCEEVLEAAFESARSIVDWDLAAATLYDPRTRRHKVLHAMGQWEDQVSGLSWRDNGGLVSQAVRMRHYLPYKGKYEASSQTVLVKKVRFKEARSLLVLPLVAQDKAIGTLLIVSRREGIFSQQVRLLLQVIADQTALSYQNALMVRRLEELATTDPLTGLFNKRVFLEALGRNALSAQRYDKKLSLIMTDLDKFKSVNDTHGHPVGDQVLIQFADVLRRNAREVDVVCRYGGEEFAVIVIETDAEGAYRMAERIRRDMERERIDTGSGTIRVTCSMGVATCPEQGPGSEELIRSADVALYEAKRSGRNRVVASSAGYQQTG